MTKTLERSTTYEGTWEEVAELAGNLSGKRVTLTVHPETARNTVQPKSSWEAPRNLVDLVAPLLEAADRLEPEPPVPHTDPEEATLDAILRKKAGRLGLEI